MSAPRVALTTTPIRDDVLRGLGGQPKMLPAKLFYDEAGAELFERICALDEYYLTRTELNILQRHASDIAAIAGSRCALIEYGSGAGVKVRLLLDALVDPVAYVPIDVSREQLARVAVELGTRYPAMAVKPLCADYTARLRLPPLPPDTRRVAFFPGSTIGNLHPAEATAFLRRVRNTVGPTGALVLGVDRVKDARVLHAAYNDRDGVTAAFNRNVLARITREMITDLEPDRFRHRAFFNPEASRIEMHLESIEEQVVHIDDRVIHFAEGETIWTESSYKYDRARLDALVSAAGFAVTQLWTDADDRFWVAYLTPCMFRA